MYCTQLLYCSLRVINEMNPTEAEPDPAVGDM